MVKGLIRILISGPQWQKIHLLGKWPKQHGAVGMLLIRISQFVF